MRVAVTGGRRFDNQKLVDQNLDRLHKHKAITLLIQGEADGADLQSKNWAKRRGVPTADFPATKEDWRMGRIGGNIRNRRMLLEGKPDYVLAFSGGSGTNDMVSAAKSMGIMVIEAVR